MQELYNKIVDVIPVRLIVILGLAAVLVGAPLFFLGLTGFTRTTESYCMSCHQYSEFREGPEFFASSLTHPASIGCEECHIENPQSLISDRHYKDEDLMDERCLACHARVLDDNVSDMTVEILRKEDSRIGRLKDESMYKFELRQVHRWHLDQKTQCVDCHRNIQHDRFTQRTNMPRIEYCIQCHPTDDFAMAWPLPELVYKIEE